MEATQVSTDRWMDKEDMRYIKKYIDRYTHTYIHTHTMEYYSAIKKWNNAIFSNMDGPRDYHTKWSKSDKDRYMISLICGI